MRIDNWRYDEIAVKNSLWKKNETFLFKKKWKTVTWNKWKSDFWSNKN